MTSRSISHCKPPWHLLKHIVISWPHWHFTCRCILLLSALHSPLIVYWLTQSSLEFNKRMPLRKQKKKKLFFLFKINWMTFECTFVYAVEFVWGKPSKTKQKSPAAIQRSKASLGPIRFDKMGLICSPYHLCGEMKESWVCCVSFFIP